MKTNFLILITVCFLSVDCTFNATNQNQESDRTDGDKVGNALYSLMSEGKLHEIEGLFGDEFFKLVTKEQLRLILEKNKAVLGDFKGNKLVDWKTVETSGSVDKTEYIMIYEVEYEKDKARETIAMVKKDDGPIKIIGYHVNSNAFIK